MGHALDGASLRRSRGWKCDLSGASLRGADLAEARLRSASASRAVFRRRAPDLPRAWSTRGSTVRRFRDAQLQSAHFDGALLHGADFIGADVRDARFLGAHFDDDALSSLVLAKGLWRRESPNGPGAFSADFLPAVQARLRALAARDHNWAWVSA